MELALKTPTRRAAVVNFVPALCNAAHWSQILAAKHSSLAIAGFLHICLGCADVDTQGARGVSKRPKYAHSQCIWKPALGDAAADRIHGINQVATARYLSHS